MARQLGARRFWDAFGSKMGGFGVGGPPPTQSSVASPTPAAAGVSGQPPSGPGGMSVGQRPDDLSIQGGEGNEGAPSNANVTGLNASLMGHGLTFASGGPFSGMLGVPSGGSLLGGAVGQATGSPIAAAITSALASLGLGAGKTAGLNAATRASEGMVSQGSPATATSSAIPAGSPVTYGGQLGGIPGMVAGMFGIPTGTAIANVPSDPTVQGTTNPALQGEVTGIPSQGRSVQVPSVSPNVGQYGGFGVGPAPSTFSGFAGHSSGISGQGGRTAGTAPTGPPSNDPNHFGVRASDPIDAAIPDADFGVPNSDLGVPAEFSDPVDLGLPEGTPAPAPDGPTATGPAPSPTGEETGLPDGVAVGEAGPTSSDTGLSDAGVAAGLGISADAGGSGSGGASSLLCNYALDSGRCGDKHAVKKSRRDLDAIIERAFREKPGMRDSFKDYQKVSRQIIAKMKALPAEQEEAAFADLQTELVVPVTKAARRGDATTVGRALRRATMKLAKEYSVDIPEDYLVRSEEHVGPRAEDDKTYNTPSGKIQKPSPKRLMSMLEAPDFADDEAHLAPVEKPEKVAGTGGMSVGLAAA